VGPITISPWLKNLLIGLKIYLHLKNRTLI
jgi:hypothetical protein